MNENITVPNYYSSDTSGRQLFNLDTLITQGQTA